MVPERPAFMCNGEDRGNRIDLFSDQNVPVDLGEVVHFFIEDFGTGEGVGWLLVLLVSVDI